MPAGGGMRTGVFAVRWGGGKAADRLDHRRGSGAFKPGRRTPRILVGYWHQAMSNRGLMGVVEARQVGFLAGEARFTVVEPEFAKFS